MADAEYPPRQKVGASQLPAWLSFTSKPPGQQQEPKGKIIIKKDKKGKNNKGNR